MPAAAEPDPAGGRVSTRYAGAMLLHAFYARAGAGALLPGVAGPDATLLTAVAMCFALGAHTTGQFKHLAPGEAGPLAGLAVLPGLRALRPRLARLRRRPGPARAAAGVRFGDAGRQPGH